MKQPLLHIILTVLLTASLSSALVSKESEKVMMDADLFELDGKINSISASGNVVVSDMDIVITGKKATYTQNNSVITLRGNVILSKDKLHLTCEEARAFEIEERVEAIGKVQFNYGDIQGKSNKAVYFEKEKLIELSGSPVVTRGSDTLRGELIAVYLDGGKIVTSGKTKVIFSVENLE
ncbi:MAG: hypothetical protein HRT90_11610 [Candidatus Margulisbacteria bacterium]|nr:hypothetical protein [Candidatus Margulisiibacteriota bacterium]